MINFFRKIRHRLFSQNKFSKYLLYAVGEIVLVVIGILIALQINNWNETRKIKQKESLILNEIRNSIVSDLKGYEDWIDPRIERKKGGIDSLITYIFNESDIPDSLFIEFYNRAGQDVFMRFDNGPFDALKSTGLDIIQNDSLRTAINDAYAVKLPLYRFFSNDLYQDSREEIRARDKNFLGIVPFLHEDGRKHLHEELVAADILHNQDFLLNLQKEQFKLDEYTFRLKQMKEILENLKVRIETELGD